MRLDEALQNLAALTRFRVRDLDVRYSEFPLGVEIRIAGANFDAGVIDGPKTAPSPTPKLSETTGY
jgi:hypothetical protein